MVIVLFFSHPGSFSFPFSFVIENIKGEMDSHAWFEVVLFVGITRLFWYSREKFLRLSLRHLLLRTHEKGETKSRVICVQGVYLVKAFGTSPFWKGGKFRFSINDLLTEIRS